MRLPLRPGIDIIEVETRSSSWDPGDRSGQACMAVPRIRPDWRRFQTLRCAGNPHSAATVSRSGSTTSRRDSSQVADPLSNHTDHSLATCRYSVAPFSATSCLAVLMATRKLFARSARRTASFAQAGPSWSRSYATEMPPPPPLRENHGSSTNPRDSLRFADEAHSSSEADAPSSTTPLTPPNETPLPPTDFELVTSEALFPPLSAHPSRVPTVPFSTHRFVRRLEQNGVKREMAVELMKATRALLLREEERAQGELLGRQDLENVDYSYPPPVVYC